MIKSVFKFIPAIAALAIVGCSGNQPTLVVNGTTDADAETIYLTAGKDTLAAVPVANGAFKAELAIDETTPNLIYVRDNSRAAGMVFVENGTVNYTKAENAITVAGTPANDAYQAYRAASAELSGKLRAAETDEEAEAIYEEADKLDASAFEQNVSNFFGLYMLQQLQYSMEGEELEAKLAQLNPSFATTPEYEKLSSRAEILKKTAIGQPYIDVKLADQNGKELALSSYVGEGKYVLLDFWASWCGPCMRELPDLVPAYNKFNKKGFEIFGVSLDSDKEDWVNAIKDNKMDWIHVSDLKYWQSAGAALYGVNSIPANYLIGPDGTIVAKNLRGKGIATKLAEILGE